MELCGAVLLILLTVAIERIFSDTWDRLKARLARHKKTDLEIFYERILKSDEPLIHYVRL